MRKETVMKISGNVCASAVIAAAVLAASAFVSCSMGIERGSDIKKIERSAVDARPYTDVTLSSVNARLIGKEDFAQTCEGRYENGSSYIEVNYERGKLRLYTPAGRNPSCAGQQVEAEFIYSVKAASQHCLYLCPATKNGLKVKIGGKETDALSAPSFLLYVPLYGFGAGRIEMSPVMGSETAMPSGTYWLKK